MSDHRALKAPPSLMTVGIFVLIANTFVLLAMRKLRTMKKSTFIFLMHLTITDLLLGIVIVSQSILIMAGSLNMEVCAVMLSFSLGLLGSSSSAIMFLYLELFLAVKYMALFRNPLSKTHAGLMLGLSFVTWLAVIGIGLLSQESNSKATRAYNSERCEIRLIFTSNYLLVIGSVFLVILALTISFLLSALFIMRKQQKQIFEHRQNDHLLPESGPASGLFLADMSTASNSLPIQLNHQAGPRLIPRRARLSVYSSSCPFPNPKESFKQRWLTRKMNMTKQIAAVLVIFILCWYPSVILIMVYVGLGRGESVPSMVFNCLWIMIPLHAIANVFVYAAKSREFRKAMKESVCKNSICSHPCESNKVMDIPQR